ncbi:MAG TPA: hypothetical protein VN616_11680 [Puia sp.]|nr:hypothetical protein [Puia sp.]
MKRLLFLCCGFLAITQLIGQGPPAGGPPAGSPMGQIGAAQAAGRLYEKLVDTAGHGIARASVMIRKSVRDNSTPARSGARIAMSRPRNNKTLYLQRSRRTRGTHP